MLNVSISNVSTFMAVSRPILPAKFLKLLFVYYSICNHRSCDSFSVSTMTWTAACASLVFIFFSIPFLCPFFKKDGWFAEASQSWKCPKAIPLPFFCYSITLHCGITLPTRHEQQSLDDMIEIHFPFNYIRAILLYTWRETRTSMKNSTSSSWWTRAMCNLLWPASPLLHFYHQMVHCVVFVFFIVFVILSLMKVPAFCSLDSCLSANH